MARPVKLRQVAQLPNAGFFRPMGIPASALQEVCLSLEEVESIRLKDLEGLGQEECAQRMRISRPTFHRVLASARGKFADALVNGKAIQIEGGNFEMAMRRFHCINGHEWDVPFEVMINEPPRSCPTCNTLGILPTQPFGFGWGRGWVRHQGKGTITKGGQPISGQE